ncbi:4Fe-4S dicluster domain-containing protein [Ruminococcus sp. AF18-22]|nr:4Fe-4S dicluster domain-containing protein [Ruminococcus sp. AF18-22]
MVLYFSGTGNSAYIAERIAQALDEELCFLNQKIKEHRLFAGPTPKRMIFVLPTYAWRIPKVVEEWILKSRFTGKPDVYFVMNCGSEIGNAAKHIRRLCKKKDFCYKGCAQIIMPENYLAMFQVPKEEEAKAIIEKAEPKIEKVIQQIAAGEALEEEKEGLLGAFLSGPVNAVFYPAVVHAKKFWADDQCIGCRRCADACPLNNITMEEQRPQWHAMCTHCMACITVCPVKAIEYGTKSAGKPRYRCPM